MRLFNLIMCVILLLFSTAQFSSGESTYDIQSGYIIYEENKIGDVLHYPIYDSVNDNFTLYGYGYPATYIFPGTNFEVRNYTINTYDKEGNVETNIEKNYHVVYDDDEIVSTLPLGQGWYDRIRMFYIEGELYLMGTSFNGGSFSQEDDSNYIIILKYEGVGESIINVNDNDDISISLDVPVIKWSNLTNIPIYDFGFNEIGDNSFHSYDPHIDINPNILMLDVVRKQLFYYGYGETWIFDIEDKRWKLMTPNYIPQENCYHWVIEQDNQNYICIKNEVVYEYDVQKNRYYHHDITNNDCDAIIDGFTINRFYFYDMNSGKIIIAHGSYGYGGVCAYDVSGNLMTLISTVNFIDFSLEHDWDRSWDGNEYFMYWYQGYDNNTGNHFFNRWVEDDIVRYAYLKFDLNIGEGDTVDDEGTTTETITQIDTVTETENNVETVTNAENNVETVEFTETYNVTIANTTEIITETVLQDAYFPSLYTMSILLLIPLIIRKYKTN